jgi:adenylosuccinate lyase
MSDFNIYDCVSPLDFRYYLPDERMTDLLGEYVSEAARVRSEARVEAALARVLARRGICSEAIADEIAAAAEQVTPAEVAEEEARIRHNIRALVNSMKTHVSDEAKPYIHFTFTSFDVIDTANAWRLRGATHNAVIPVLLDLERTLIELTRREAETCRSGGLTVSTRCRSHSVSRWPSTSVGWAVASRRSARPPTVCAGRSPARLGRTTPRRY